MTLDTLDRLETDDGLFFNYYDTTSLERTSHFVSFVDSAWLTAGLMVVRMAFPEFYERCAALIDQMRFGTFYDPALRAHLARLLRRAARAVALSTTACSTPRRVSARLIAIGKGDVPESVWFEMVRTFPADCRWQSLEPVGVREKSVLGHTSPPATTSGAAPATCRPGAAACSRRSCRRWCSTRRRWRPKSLGANDRAHVLVQHRFAVRDLRLPVWGLSPSATPGSEQYGEYGVKILGSLGYPAGAGDAACVGAGARRGAGRGADQPAPARRSATIVYGDYGFYDAVDPRTGRVAYKYLTLDQSMIFLALANHLADHAVQKRFASDPIIERVLPLLAAEDFFE